MIAPQMRQCGWTWDDKRGSNNGGGGGLKVEE